MNLSSLKLSSFGKPWVEASPMILDQQGRPLLNKSVLSTHGRFLIVSSLGEFSTRSFLNSLGGQLSEDGVPTISTAFVSSAKKRALVEENSLFEAERNAACSGGGHIYSKWQETWCNLQFVMWDGLGMDFDSYYDNSKPIGFMEALLVRRLTIASVSLKHVKFPTFVVTSRFTSVPEPVLKHMDGAILLEWQESASSLPDEETRAVIAHFAKPWQRFRAEISF